MKLRPYQTEVLRAVTAGWDARGPLDDPTKQLVVAPTGAGKTIIFALLARQKAARGERTLVLAHRDELVQQARDKILRATGIEAQIEKADQRASHAARVVVASIQTLMRDNRRNRWAPDHFGLVVADEAHHAISPSWQVVLRHFDRHADVVGVTATPDRGDKKNLARYFTSLAAEIRLPDLIRDGYLSPITIRSVPLQIDLNQVRSVAGDLDQAELGNAIEPYLDQIARSLVEFAPGRRTLAFLPLIATSQKFVEACRKAGLRAEHIDGYDEHRALKLGSFAQCDYDVLSNAMLLTEGFDDEGIDCVLVLRPTKSRALYAQMIGRGTRLHPLKSDLLILDFLWMHERHPLARPASLVARDQDEAEAMTKISQEASGGDGEQDLLVLQGDAVAQREESLRKRLLEQAKKKGKYISADEWAAQHDRLALADYQPTFAWEEKPVSEKQSRVLKRAGIDLETVRGAGHASQLISAILGDVAHQACTPAQRALLRRIGHESPDSATLGEFRQAMARLKTRTMTPA